MLTSTLLTAFIMHPLPVHPTEYVCPFPSVADAIAPAPEPVDGECLPFDVPEALPCPSIDWDMCGSVTSHTYECKMKCYDGKGKLAAHYKAIGLGREYVIFPGERYACQDGWVVLVDYGDLCICHSGDDCPEECISAAAPLCEAE